MRRVGQPARDGGAARFRTLPSRGFLGQPDENSFGAADIAESIRVLVLHHFADELRAVFAEPRERRVEVFHREHDAQVAESVHWGVAMVGDDRRGKKARKLEPAVAVGGDHHGDLDVTGENGPAVTPDITLDATSDDADPGATDQEADPAGDPSGTGDGGE